jgi:hypothetical protein
MIGKNYKIMKETLSSRIKKLDTQLKAGAKELKSFEDLISDDGYDVTKLDKKELIKLIDKKATSLKKDLSDSALNVFVTSRCGGSYGCQHKPPQ